MRWISIKTKLSLGLSALLLLAFAAINLINYNVSRNSVRHNIINESLPSVSKNIYSEIQNNLMVPHQVSSLMANDTFLKDWVLDGEQDPKSITRYLCEIQIKYGFVSAFLVSYKSNKYYHYKGMYKLIRPDDPHDIWFYDFIERGVQSELDVDTDETDKDSLTIFINHRLNDYHGGLLGITGVGLSMSQIGATLAGFEKQYNKTVYLVDGSGLIQAHANHALVEAQNIYDLKGIGDIATNILDAPAKLVVNEYDDEDGQHVILISRYIPEFKWFLIVEQMENLALADIRKNFIHNIVIGLVVTCFVILINIFLVNHFQGRLEKMAITDDLTQIFNRGHFLELGRHEMAQSLRYGRSISLLMIDADHFKAVNDNHGHDVGDKVLHRLAQAITQQIREVDILARAGGEEFVVLLPQTDLKHTLTVAERIRAAVAAMELEPSHLRVTVSLGAAQASSKTKTLEELMKMADQALYLAKDRGRNQVCVFEYQGSA